MLKMLADLVDKGLITEWQAGYLTCYRDYVSNDINGYKARLFNMMLHNFEREEENGKNEKNAECGKQNIISKECK